VRHSSWRQRWRTCDAHVHLRNQATGRPWDRSPHGCLALVAHVVAFVPALSAPSLQDVVAVRVGIVGRSGVHSAARSPAPVVSARRLPVLPGPVSCDDGRSAPGWLCTAPGLARAYGRWPATIPQQHGAAGGARRCPEPTAHESGALAFATGPTWHAVISTRWRRPGQANGALGPCWRQGRWSGARPLAGRSVVAGTWRQGVGGPSVQGDPAGASWCTGFYWETSSCGGILVSCSGHLSPHGERFR
jgi:hypothetical protein